MGISIHRRYTGADYARQWGKAINPGKAGWTGSCNRFIAGAHKCFADAFTSRLDARLRTTALRSTQQVRVAQAEGGPAVEPSTIPDRVLPQIQAVMKKEPFLGPDSAGKIRGWGIWQSGGYSRSVRYSVRLSRLGTKSQPDSSIGIVPKAVNNNCRAIVPPNADLAAQANNNQQPLCKQSARNLAGVHRSESCLAYGRVETKALGCSGP